MFLRETVHFRVMEEYVGQIDVLYCVSISRCTMKLDRMAHVVNDHTVDDV